MKKILTLFTICLLVFSCNSSKKYAAYECEEYLESAIEDFSEGYYSVTQARRAYDFDSMRKYLKRAMSYFDDAEECLKQVSDIAYDYDPGVTQLANEASSCAALAYQDAVNAYNSQSDNAIDIYTKRSQSNSSSGESKAKKAKDSLWY